ncbi:MAG: choice-of-anchor D domain-containing protein, partial [Caldilineaceae bacterium]|nr:choice-of-anchor D domain-containing protein [Caldilineaceae bacterium]
VITVNTFADELNANGNCSLREAIQAANTNAAVDACPAGGNSAADVINLPAGTYTLAIAGVNETANAKGDLNILGDVIINGASAATTIINANSIDRVFTVASNKTVHMNALTIMGGTVVYGGGIQNLGNLTITNSTIKDNVAATAGGIDSSGTLMLIGSTISGNRITAGGYGGLWNHGSATLVNSTVSGNTSSNVGGIYNDQNSSLTLINVTVSGNGKTNDNKSGIGNAGTLILSNTIINNNCANTGAGTASATSHHNLMLNSSNACGLVNGVNNNQVGANPQLGTLANNQGNTFTHALLVGSPAIDAGDVATCAAAPVNNRDQRNFARPVDGNDDTSAVCDIGSFEFRATASQPEIDVQGNNVSITSGDTTPSTIDDTDFGRAEDDGNFATSHLFTINNLGNEQLDISDIMLSGAGKDEFRLTFVGSNPPTSVPPNNTPQDSFVFFVDFGPRTPGLHQATVSIANNDDNENPYTFAIQGTGGAADGDNDGIPDGTDNCPAVSNPDQANFDGDGQGDACDADDDNDGLSDVNEAAAGTNPHNPDTDNDTVGDNSDICPLRGPVVAVVSNNTPLCPAPANTVTAAGAASPIAVNLHGQSSFGVPVRFAANGPKISSVDFKLTYDKSCLAFDDTTDGNNDGLPDALVGLPNTHVTSFQHNAGTGDLTLIIAPPNSNPPLPLLTDGTLVTVRFNVLPACVTNDGTTKLLTFGLSNQHYGNDQGQSVNGSTLVEDYELRFNANPTDITLDNGRVNENANNAVVGTLDSLDIDEAAPRPGDSHT